MSARIAARSPSAGRASAIPAASGTPSSRRPRRWASARPRRGAAAPGGALPARGSLRRFDAAAAHRHRHRRARPRRRRRLRDGFGDADRRRAGHRQIDAADPGLRGARRGAAGASSMSRARNRPSRCACAPRASASPTRRCNWPRRPWSRTSSPRSARATRPNSSSSIRSRRCGAMRSNPRPAR